jgi:uncharacterized membrane protein (UPF0182 family)
MAGRYPRGPFDPFEPRGFEGFPEIHIPRPPRRFWIGLGFIAAALLIIFLGSPIIGFITENQWYDALGLGQVYRTRVGIEYMLFFISFFVALAFTAANAIAALRLRSGLALRAVGIRRRIVRTGVGAAALAACALIGLILSAGAVGDWQHFALFRNYNATGTKDPLFGQDVSFYLLTLPFLHDIQGWLLGLLILTGLVCGVLYVWRGDTLDLRLTRPALAHLSILLGLLALVIAGGTLLNRYDLLYSHNGLIWGAGYTDVNVRSGLAVVQAIFGLLLAGLVFANVYFRRPRLLLVAVGAWIVGAILVGIYPALVQRVSVTPAELSQESPYIQREIAFTRSAYGISDFTTQNFGGDQPISAEATAADAVTIDNLRLWDNKPIQQTYQQLQSIRTYYAFKDIDLDRYTLNGTTKQVEISAREVEQSRLPPQAQGWFNQKLVYTHGYAVAASPVSAVRGDGLPDYVVGDVPPSGLVQITTPQIYFGESTNDYVLAPSVQPEFDYPKGNENVHNSYTGTHGVRMDGANKVLWSLRTGDFNLLVSDQVQSRTEILYRRNIQDRIHAIAPFLQMYESPYIVVVGGKLYWIQDAYIGADTYPYSQNYGELTNGHNYLRNSVKVVIDAYDGTPTFYIADQKDPIIKAYAGVFPTLFHPISSMPAGLQAHLRVPQRQFLVQSTAFATYHVSDPSTLYNREDVWQQAVDPYYVEMRLPGAPQAEYLQIIPFTPLNKSNLVGWLAVRNDPGHYGQLVSFVLPKDKVVLGPDQIHSRINQTPDFSRDKTLLNQNGSSLIEGNLLAVPIGNSFLYFEPIYLQATTTQGLPQLRAVLVTDATGQTPVVYQPTLSAAIQQLVGQAPQPPSTTTPTPPSTTPPPTSGGGTSQQVASLVLQANQHYQAAQAALRNGDLGLYQSEIQQVGSLLQQISQLTGGSPAASPSPSPHPSG